MSEQPLRLRAHAKINLCLRLGPPRPDGYHRLATLFQRLELADELLLEPAPETSVEGFPDTLVTRALELLGETRRVRLEKHIPVAAGLGGGSSDAAAVLRALQGERSVNELYAMARELGADVPFFLSGAETALGLARGDRITPLPDFPRSFGVVLVLGEGLETADVYARATPSDIFLAREGDLLRAAYCARRVEQVAALVANELEPAALSLRPELAAALEALRAAGALAAAVSGSGPTVFGIFADPAAAAAAAGAIPGAVASGPV